jgi:adenylate kinase family enzyme
MKIAIIGSPGSGKSTFALKLHKILNIPLFHIDQYFWKHGWQRPDRQEFEKIHNQLCDASSWIIEGMAIKHFQYRLQKADIIIFLDIPWYVCFYRIFKRAFLNYGKVLFSSAPGCPEKFPSLGFLHYTYKFHRNQKQEVKKLLAHYQKNKHIFIIKNQNDLDAAIRHFK